MLDICLDFMIIASLKIRKNQEKEQGIQTLPHALDMTAMIRKSHGDGAK